MSAELRPKQSSCPGTVAGGGLAPAGAHFSPSSDLANFNSSVPFLSRPLSLCLFFPLLCLCCLSLPLSFFYLHALVSASGSVLPRAVTCWLQSSLCLSQVTLSVFVCIMCRYVLFICPSVCQFVSGPLSLCFGGCLCVSFSHNLCPCVSFFVCVCVCVCAGSFLPRFFFSLSRSVLSLCSFHAYRMCSHMSTVSRGHRRSR